MSNRRLFWLVLIVATAATAYALDLHRLVTLENFEARQSQVEAWVNSNRPAAAAGYFALYVLMAAASIPGAAVLTLIGGALFGVVQGTLLVSFASSIGATLAFLLARFLLRDYVERRFPKVLGRMNKGIDAEGGYYLFTLRLVPAFPFFAINLVAGLTRLRALTFYWVSQLGMLPATVVYVNAGTQIGQLETLGGILSPGLIGSFVLLGVFPLLTRKLLTLVKVRQQC